MTFRLSARADQELAALFLESVDRFGEAHAEGYVAGLRRTCVLLAENPQIARERAELTSRARAFRYKAHMIVYRIEGDDILIIRLPHARSDWINELA